MATEEVWLRRGVKARRTRDEGRVKALMAMRAERAARRNQMGQVRLQIEQADASGKMVFEAADISFAYPGAKVPVVRDFSIRVMRGDRIGLIGPNGSGKTTFLKLLLGELEPATGDIRRGANVEVAYYDQQREQLDPDRSVVDTIGDGNDTVTVNGQPRHVHGYLQDFLFSPERARSPVRALSGGERNRLLLARLFTRPANVLVLDEPTNDLDLETLELLEQQLVEWPGTLLLVSHDRRFLDNVVTSTVVFEGGGQSQEYVGGYEDWLRQIGHARKHAKDPSGSQDRVGKCQRTVGITKRPRTNVPSKKSASTRTCLTESPRSKPSNSSCRRRLPIPRSTRNRRRTFTRTLDRVTAIEGELLAALERWDALDSIGKRLKSLRFLCLLWPLSFADRLDLIPLFVGHRLHGEPGDAHERHVRKALVGFDLGERDRPLERLAGSELNDHQAPGLVVRIGIRSLRDRGGADDRLLFSGVIEEDAVALLHLAQVALRDRIPHTRPDRAPILYELCRTNNSPVLP